MSSAITALPRIRIEVAGEALSAAGSRALSELLVEQRLSLPTLCELGFANLNEADASAVSFEPGLDLKIFVGNTSSALFTGQVTAVEYDFHPSRGSMLRVRAYDPLHRLRKRQPVRAYVQVSLSDLVSEISSDLGLTVEAPTGGPLWRRIIQYRQNDLDFLSDLAAHSGLYLFVEGNRLRAIDLGGSGTPITLRLHHELQEARIEVNGDTACRDVTAFGWDPSHLTWHSAAAGQANSGRRIQASVPPESVGGSGQRTFTNETSSDAAHATSVAQAELDVRTAREVRFFGVAAGDPELRPGATVDLKGIAGNVAGTYVLTAATHVVDRTRGYVTELSTDPPARQPRQPGFFTAPAKVTQVDDPEGLGRVQVSLPTFNDLETDWMCILSAGAGAGKGLMALPDVGDHVMVLVSVENPALGFVLGSLYGSQGMPDTGIESGIVARYTLLTPGGQRVKLDDSKKMMRLENSSGSFVELLPGRVTVHANCDMLLQAPGRQVLIQAEKIDFKRA